MGSGLIGGLFIANRGWRAVIDERRRLRGYAILVGAYTLILTTQLPLVDFAAARGCPLQQHGESGLARARAECSDPSYHSAPAGKLRKG